MTEAMKFQLKKAREGWEKDGLRRTIVYNCTAKDICIKTRDEFEAEHPVYTDFARVVFRWIEDGPVAYTIHQWNTYTNDWDVFLEPKELEDADE
jgi:hypothetical protein